MATEPNGLRSRRALLAAAAGSAAAVVASAALPLTTAAAASNVVTEQDNPSSATTSITDNGVTAPPSVAFDGNWGGVRRRRNERRSFRGSRLERRGADVLLADLRARLHEIQRCLRVSAVIPRRERVGIGVWGDSPDIGVYGSGGSGVVGFGAIGVEGQTNDQAGSVGVWAEARNTSQIALKVKGKVSLSRSGRTTMLSGASSKTIPLAGVTSSSKVFGVLATNCGGRGSGRSCLLPASSPCTSTRR